MYAATQSEYQRVMLWGPILKEFGPNIQHLAGVDNNIWYSKKIDICVYRQVLTQNNEISVSNQRDIPYWQDLKKQ